MIESIEDYLNLSRLSLQLMTSSDQNIFTGNVPDGEVPYMTRFFTMCIGSCPCFPWFSLLGLHVQRMNRDYQADLNVTKVVTSTGPYEVDDTVTWVVTLWNNGPGQCHEHQRDRRCHGHLPGYSV